jgi:DNA-binding response OmpR family regulator
MLSKIISIFKPKILQKHIKVLVIEDTAVDQRIACAAIERGGYTALKAVDGKTGFELAKEQKPQLIILDYNLPDIKGPELCKLLKAHADTHQIPVLFLTSLTDPDYVVNCFEQGENYLSKPISTDILLKQINSILKDNYPKE